MHQADPELVTGLLELFSYVLPAVVRIEFFRYSVRLDGVAETVHNTAYILPFVYAKSCYQTCRVIQKDRRVQLKSGALCGGRKNQQVLNIRLPQLVSSGSFKPSGRSGTSGIVHGDLSGSVSALLQMVLQCGALHLPARDSSFQLQNPDQVRHASCRNFPAQNDRGIHDFFRYRTRTVVRRFGLCHQPAKPVLCVTGQPSSNGSL